MKYKVILFDADGVVLKSARRFSEQIEMDYGIKTATLQPFFTGIFRECTVGRADLKEELKKVIADWGWKGTVEELMDYWFTSGTLVDEEVMAFVQTLRAMGVRCFMTTDQEKYRGMYLQNLLENGKSFERVFFSAEIGHKKSEPVFFEHVWKAISGEGVDSKGQVLFVDDDEKNVEVAKTFGFDAHFYTGLQELKTFIAG